MYLYMYLYVLYYLYVSYVSLCIIHIFMCYIYLYVSYLSLCIVCIICIFYFFNQAYILDITVLCFLISVFLILVIAVFRDFKHFACCYLYFLFLFRTLSMLESVLKKKIDFNSLCAEIYTFCIDFRL